uniref:Pericentrin (kendrin) n=1 Tax=Cricetulus griseus TaxID=10029 RepID=A0A8C2MER4_CRIGR
MDEDEQEERRRKVEAGRAKLASFRQRKTKGDCPNSKKKTAKRKGSAVNAPVQEEGSVAPQNSELPQGGAGFESTSCSNTLEGTRGAFAAQERQDCELDEPGLQAQQQQPQPQPQPTQTAHSLELEALRLSLNNMHTAQLELTQANLQKEKETALTELREMLNGRRAQELALLQSRQQCELELMREQLAREKEEVVLRCGQETAELKEKLRSEMEKSVQMIETLKQDWESERQLCLENLRKELSAKHQSEMEGLQNQFQRELAEQRAELEKIFQAKHEAEVSLKETQHQAAVKKLQEDLQSEHCQYLQDLEMKFREKEKEKELELENLQASYEELKAQSQEEIRCLWSQLESVKTNTEELNGSWEPCLAQDSHLEELEHLRSDFAQQQQQERRAQHELELEHLRVYFEKKLRDAEKTYQEDLTLFQQRLQEAREDSLESGEISSSCIFPEETSGRGRKEQPDPLDLQLEQLKVKHSLVEDHQVKLNKAEEKIQLMKQEFQKKEAEWERSHEDFKRDTEGRLTSMFIELREKAESEKQSIISRFEHRESGMRHLQEQQAAQILDLERSLMEQQGRLRQLEQELTRDEVLPCSRCGQEPLMAQDEEHIMLLRVKEDCALQLMMAQNRFLEERKEIMEKFAKEQDAFLRDTQEKHAHELQLLQQGHQQQLQALKIELETKHHSELAEQLASLESKQQALVETHVAELQVKHNAEISTLQMKHLTDLHAAKSFYLTDIETIRDEHRKALELLQAELEDQLQKKDSSHKEILTHELEKLKHEELQSAKDSLRIKIHAKHTEEAKGLATDMQGTQQEELAMAVHNQRHLLGKDGNAALGSVGAEVLLHPAVPQELGDPHAVEMQKPQAELAKSQELPASQEQAALVRIPVFSLSREVEECRAELERLQQRRERENQEDTTLICMLRADADLAQSKGSVLRDALRRLLGLFGETLKAAVTLKSRISERAGLLLDHVDATDTSDAQLAAAALGDMWSDEGLLEIDRTLPEGAETSSVSEISSHVCESFFMSPENTLECEQPIRKVYQSLSTAVDGLLEMALDSSKQLEEAHQLHCCVEKELRHRNEEMAQAVQKQQELLEHLRQESAAKDGLTLELHMAEGLLEGLRVEKAELQEALDKKEESEQQLILELESLQKQLQQVAQELVTLREENSVLWNQKETFTNEAKEREAALQKEVESLSRDQWEARKQSEKDRATLLSQMRVLESELEDQLVQHRGCAQLTEEVATLKQELAALDKHLRSQRQFMDEQAAEREHEREEFQQEIQRLEEQLRQAARPRPPGPRDSQVGQPVELLQEKLREKLDGFNELVIKKDFADQQLLIQEKEIKRLEETNVSLQRQVAQLQEELEKQKKNMEELKVKFWQELTSDLLLPPVSQCRLDEAECPKPSQDSSSRGPETQPEVTESTHLEPESEVVPSRNSEIEELKAIIENLRENQEQLQKDKAEEIEQLHEVIEKLQSELTLMGPKVHELSDHQASSLHTELSCLRAEGQHGQALWNELEAAQAAKEVFGQLLADQAHGHSQVLEALQQRLQDAEVVAAKRLAELEHCVALREAEVEGMASRIQEFEALLKAKEAIIVQRDLEIDSMNKWKATHSLELETILLPLAHFRRALEQQTLATSDEPPELQQLRIQCARLSHQLQVLHHRFLQCQMEPDQQQAPVAPADCSSPGADAQWQQDSVSMGLASFARSLSSQAKEQQLEDCQLGSGDLIIQVQQLQEKLNHLVHSMASRDTSMENPKSERPSLSENGSSSDCHNDEDISASLPIDVFSIGKTTWDVIDVIKNQDLLAQVEMPSFPTQEPLTPQGGSLSSQVSVHSDSLHPEEAEPQKDPARALDLSSWSSPEVLRKDSTPEPQHSLPLTPCTGTVSLHSVDTSSQDWTDSLQLADASGLLCYPGKSATAQAPLWVVTPSAENHHVERPATEKDVEDFIVTSFDSQELLTTSPHELTRSDATGKSDCPSGGMMLTLGSGGSETPRSSPVAAAVVPFSRRFDQSPGAMKEKEIHAKHMKALLQMVFDESHQILALSKNQDLPNSLSKGEPRDPLDGLPRDRQALLEATADRGEKEPSETCLTWSGELLRAIQEVFAREQENAELQSRPYGLDLGDYNVLFKRLEKVIKEQGDLQKVQCLPDRSSLLSEIQALRAQLRMTHLQNQEKLQQLCAALTSTEARGSQREHQLRRQVELLAYKVEQEKCIASDLQKTLNKEQEKASDVRKLLMVEQSAVQDLKSELHACKQENTRLLESLDKVQQEVLRLRYGPSPYTALMAARCFPPRAMLDGKENELKGVLQELECERGKERALQAQHEEQQLRHLQREGQSSRALEELKMSLEKQRAQNNQLCVALKHERAAKDNLQKELQIESSRCEALLAQEKGQLSELQKSLEAERSRSLELSEALQHERLLTEQLSRNMQEACARQETQIQHALLRKLKAEKARALELESMLEKVKKEAAHTQQQLESQAQERCVELRKEKERELELQCQRDEHKIEQLQQMVRELKRKEKVPGGDGACRVSPRLGSLDLDHVQEQQQELEKIRQQLLCAAGLLTSFTNHTVDRTIKDWTSSNEKAVSSLMRTLEELKSELSIPASSKKKMAAELHVQLMNELLRDNDTLTKAISMATQEKAELCRTVSRLEKTLKHHMQKGCILSRQSKSSGKQDGMVPQSPLRNSDPEWHTATTSMEANTYNTKMEKLYLHYLRAESFRKALIYQKKYLLLLIGGFQDSEQETLSMIAHLGVFPSKADKKITTSRPFTKFRTAVRVVIAIQRLRFLVKKWREVDRRGALIHGKGSRQGHRMSRRQHSLSETRASLPSKEVSSGHTKDARHSLRSLAAVPLGKVERSTSSPNSRLERSLTASQDPEHSLTEYIHHLEMIQQRLGGLPADSTQKSCHQKVKQ